MPTPETADECEMHTPKINKAALAMVANLEPKQLTETTIPAAVSAPADTTACGPERVAEPGRGSVLVDEAEFRIFSKFLSIAREKRELSERAMTLRGRSMALDLELRDCDAAARFFGVESLNGQS